MEWGHYKLVYNPREAELILVVRTGRAVEMNGGLQRGTRVGPGPVSDSDGSGWTIGANHGDWEDTLDVYLASQDLKNAQPLWRGRAANGLKTPGMPLLKGFQSKVEASTKKKP